MSDRDTLAALVARVEAATAEQQREVLLDAIDFAEAAGWLLNAKASIARQWVRLGAFLDAALTLVPEGWDWHVQANPSVEACWASVTRNIRQRVSSEMRKAATPALALTAAALRARMEGAP